jgi:hypothetical protein
MTKLFKAHTIVESFVCEKMQGKLERLRLESANPQKIEALQVALATPRSVHKSTSEFIDHMLRESSIEKEENRRMIVHLMYIAIQEQRELSSKEFEEEYRISPDALKKPDAQSLQSWHRFLSQTILWKNKGALLQECENAFKDPRYTC